MVTSREKVPSSSSSMSSSSSSCSAHDRHRSSSSAPLRPPLSPLHHNCSHARPPPHHPSLAPRRFSSNPNCGGPLPPKIGASSPLPRHPARIDLTLPRSPKPKAPRGLCDDAARRLKLQKEKYITPAASTPAKPSSLHRNPPQANRQTHLFAEHANTGCGVPRSRYPASMEQSQDEKNKRPCRKKWRRFPRESVLKSLRGEVQENSLVSAATFGEQRWTRTTNTCGIAENRPNRSVESLQGPEPTVKDESECCQQLSLEVYALATLSSDLKFSLSSDAEKEADKDDKKAFVSHSEINGDASETGEKAITVENSPSTKPNGSCRENGPSASTPSPSRSLTLTPPSEKSITPPMQPTESPDFIKREGARTVLPEGDTCFAVPSALVKYRRKCKPRGVLTVDTEKDTLSSAECELGSVLKQSAQELPVPATASVEWMVDQKPNLETSNSPRLESVSMDLCRMSVAKLYPPQGGLLSDRLALTSSPQRKDSDEGEQDGDFQRTSFPISGYEWTASSSHNMFSSQDNRAEDRRSVPFDDDDGDEIVDWNHSFSASLTSEPMHNILTEETSNGHKHNADRWDGNYSFNCWHSKHASSLEGSAPFECSVLGPLEIIRPSGPGQNSWSDCSPEEVVISRSGPMVSSLSSQELDSNEYFAANTLIPVLCNTVEPTAIRRGNQNFVQTHDKRSHEALPLVGKDISSKLAMARFLCDVTATYLDDIATCLDKGGVDVNLERSPSKDVDADAHNIGIEHLSVLAGRKKMMECCSLLRGLTLETSKSKKGCSTASEWSVKQPCPSWNEDTADSVMTRVHSRHLSCRFQKRIPSMSDLAKVSSFELSHQFGLPGDSQHLAHIGAGVRVEVWLPAKAAIACLYLLIGLFVISHVYCKHVKPSNKPLDIPSTEMA